VARVDVPRVGAEDGTENADGDEAEQEEDSNHALRVPGWNYQHKS
jgi:hypothetical protein